MPKTRQTRTVLQVLGFGLWVQGLGYRVKGLVCTGQVVIHPIDLEIGKTLTTQETLRWRMFEGMESWDEDAKSGAEVKF